MERTTHDSSTTTIYTPMAASSDSCSSSQVEFVQYEDSSPANDRGHLDIAIVGMGCRVPGGNNSPAELWDYLMGSKEASGDMPEIRWQPYHGRNPRNAETLVNTITKGYYLDRLEDFDPAFFAISPREAEQMDPQQRITLEVAWEALEHAGIAPQSLSGSNTAVYMGVNSDDYGKLILEDLQNVEAHMGVGTAYCGIPSRISYILNLLGPSFAVDAACASSLVAIHQARQALLMGETDLAIAGGANALIGPGLTRVLQEAGAIADDGKCRSFDDSAHGYGRGEGAGIVIMKRLSQAIVDNDHIIGVLKGSAVAADGKTLGIMAPNPEAQKLVARAALAEANVPASSISYIEAHATSTSVGDPAETQALAEVYGHAARSRGSGPCLIGSIKSNIGHLEAGAGVMGLIKALMVLQNRVVPAQVNLEVLNRKIDWQQSMLLACKESTGLESTELPLRAAIASYGYSGTVSHAIIETAPQIDPISVQDSSLPSLLLLSAPQPDRIQKAAQALAQWLETKGSNVQLEEIATTLAVRRGHHKYRSCVVATNKVDAISLLRKLATGSSDTLLLRNTISPQASVGPVWVFSGHGSHWTGMGYELYKSSTSFADTVQQMEPIIQQELGFSAIEALLAGTFENTKMIQVLTFVMHMGIAAVLMDISGPPSAVIGHSLGETAAAVVSGAITLIEGTLIVCRRARLYQTVAGKGAMSVVSLTREECTERLNESPDLTIAIDASPTSCVVSGPKDAIANLNAAWRKDGIEMRSVDTDVAFHSSMLKPLGRPLFEALEHDIFPQPPRIKLYSTSSKDPLAQDIRDAHYWVNNMISPVLLRDAVVLAARDGYRAFVEVSSHPIITHSINETLEDAGLDDFLAIPTMLRNKTPLDNIFTAVGKIHCFGCPIKYTQESGRPWSSEVPGTLWSHKPYWRKVADVRFGKSTTHNPTSNDLLGARTDIWGSEKVLFETRIDETTKPFPGKHPLHGSEIVPAAVLITTFLNASHSNHLQDISLKVPVVVSPARDVQVLADLDGITISSRLANQGDEGGSWLTNTTCKVGSENVLPSVKTLDITNTRARLTRHLEPSFATDYLANVGVAEMGFPWKVTEHLENDTEMLARVENNPENSSGMKTLWTSMLDSATSIASTIFHREPKLRMPRSVRKVVRTLQSECPVTGYIYCCRTDDACGSDILLCSEDGTVLIEIQGMTFAGIEGESSLRSDKSNLVHRLVWTPVLPSETPNCFQHVVFLTEKDNPLVVSYQSQLDAKGYSTEVIHDATKINSTQESTVIVHVPRQATSKDDIFEVISTSCSTLVSATNMLAARNHPLKLFCVVAQGNNTSHLGSSPLYGLSRIISSEHPEVWGGLFEAEDGLIPLSAMRYVQHQDIVRIDDGIPKTACLRSISARPSKTALTFRPGRTYLITGGLGALGLEIATWMTQRGARRLLLVSRQKLPHRSTWSSHMQNPTIQKIVALEDAGATVITISLDISEAGADSRLAEAIADCNVPPVAGVVHAAGILKDQLVKEITAEAFDGVLAPKIKGALNLDKLFPPGFLEFFTMFSSCGQLFGFPGQASYASGNAFLDCLAAQRRALGDNASSILWTSWRGLGMAASTDYINAELNARGISDITKEEGFTAWEEISRHDIDHAVVLWALTLELDDPLPHSILRDIVVRKPHQVVDVQNGGTPPSNTRPTSGLALKTFVTDTVVSCVASALSVDAADVDHAVALSEMGMDSVMTVLFRTSLQQKLRIKVSPTLVE
ncbi:hypothetical protein QM012_000761 [Aureobasidium pullulans]|uniref:6-methylsalicylic acid synthase n=1 Tax=Aureobasidium pullulans TaxID=5580 RepID=A0ABR0TWS7_AURPU